MSAFGFNVKDSIQLDLAHVVKNLYAVIVNVGQISEVDFRVFGHISVVAFRATSLHLALD